MSSMRSVAFYGLRIHPFDGIVDTGIDFPASIRITMAAIDPNDPVDDYYLNGDRRPLATLVLIRDIEPEMDEFDSYEEYDDDDIVAIKARLGMLEDDDDDNEGEEELANGGPSDPVKTEKARKAALFKALQDHQHNMELGDDEELANGINGKFKGKAKALDGGNEYSEDDDDDDDNDDDDGDDDDDDDDDFEQIVLCTLDPKQNYQQPLDITINESDRVQFMVHGSHPIYLTGNYLVPADEIESDSDEDSEDDGEMDDLDEELLGKLQDDYDDDMDDEEEDDELDDLEDPRVTELDSEEEAPQLVKAQPSKKPKNKRPAESDEDEIATEDAIKNVLKADDDKKMSKRQAKKLKNNAGQAVAGVAAEEKQTIKDDKKTNEQSPSNGKKVQFAEKLEQGPTATKAGQKGVRVVNGITVDDKKPGSGPGAKKSDKIGMRYIGKLKDGKVFDSNKKGQPFKFKLGSGEVIKGWDIGVQGMCVGGERRITVPAKLAYGSKSMPGIPSNSDLVFDLKLISIN